MPTFQSIVRIDVRKDKGEGPSFPIDVAELSAYIFRLVIVIKIVSVENFRNFGDIQPFCGIQLFQYVISEELLDFFQFLFLVDLIPGRECA